MNYNFKLIGKRIKIVKEKENKIINTLRKYCKYKAYKKVKFLADANNYSIDDYISLPLLKGFEIFKDNYIYKHENYGYKKALNSGKRTIVNELLKIIKYNNREHRNIFLQEKNEDGREINSSKKLASLDKKLSDDYNYNMYSVLDNQEQSPEEKIEFKEIMERINALLDPEEKKVIRKLFSGDDHLTTKSNIKKFQNYFNSLVFKSDIKNSKNFIPYLKKVYLLLSENTEISNKEFEILTKRCY